MATAQQLESLRLIYAEAQKSGHIFPAMAACEAMVETSWMKDPFVSEYHNLFEEKWYRGCAYPRASRETWEEINGQRVKQTAVFVWYPSFAESFADRMHTLHRLAGTFPEYAAALASMTPEDFVTNVSKRWSTSSTRAQTCIEIYHAHSDIFEPPVSVA
jgi:flagellum-specific peptidoglycan hydrolase FlgJ